MHVTQAILLLTQIWCQNTNTMIHNSCAVLTKYKIQNSKKYKHSHHVTQMILLLTWPFAQIQPDPMPLFFFIRSADNALSQTSTSALTWTKKFQRKKQVIFLSKASNIVLGFDLSNTYINIDDVFIFLDLGFWEKVGQLYRKKWEHHPFHLYQHHPFQL